MKGEVKKVVLAYSGGLDTSIIVKWLKNEYGCEVVAFTADVGQADAVTGRSIGMEALERQEGALRLVVAHPDTGVPYEVDRVVPAPFAADVDLLELALAHVLDRIVDEVGEQRLELNAVTTDVR